MTGMRFDHLRAYDAIAIKEIIGRVGTSRAAAAARARDRLIDFSAEILEHVERERREGDAAGKGEERTAARERLCALLTDLLLADLRALPRREVRRPSSLPAELLARYVASTFVLVLDWWEESGPAVPAGEANAYFRSMVVPVLDAQLG